ncbi:MAG: hypothetical protein M1561_03900 [Gammaproteobacteria bacterium]|nr:hypothetical protein [Gammaproteobacteria bacterium]
MHPVITLSPLKKLGLSPTREAACERKKSTYALAASAIRGGAKHEKKAEEKKHLPITTVAEFKTLSNPCFHPVFKYYFDALSELTELKSSIGGDFWRSAENKNIGEVSDGAMNTLYSRVNLEFYTPISDPIIIYNGSRPNIITAYTKAFLSNFNPSIANFFLKLNSQIVVDGFTYISNHLLLSLASPVSVRWGPTCAKIFYRNKDCAVIEITNELNNLSGGGRTFCNRGGYAQLKLADTKVKLLIQASGYLSKPKVSFVGIEQNIFEAQILDHCMRLPITPDDKEITQRIKAIESEFKAEIDYCNTVIETARDPKATQALKLRLSAFYMFALFPAHCTAKNMRHFFQNQFSNDAIFDLFKDKIIDQLKSLYLFKANLSNNAAPAAIEAAANVTNNAISALICSYL